MEAVPRAQEMPFTMRSNTGLNTLTGIFPGTAEDGHMEKMYKAMNQVNSVTYDCL